MLYYAYDLLLPVHTVVYILSFSFIFSYIFLYFILFFLLVYDLLTLELVWTRSAEKFTAFTVANNEDLLPVTQSDAWIAVAVSNIMPISETEILEKNNMATEHQVDYIIIVLVIIVVVIVVYL